MKKAKKNLKMGQMAEQPMATRRSPGPNQVVRGLKGDLNPGLGPAAISKEKKNLIAVGAK